MKALKHMLIAFVFFLPTMPAVVNGASVIGARKIAFWIGTSNNQVFDEQTLCFIAGHAGIVVLNAKLDWPEAAYTYPAVVKRLHELRPGLPVFLYTWASRWHETNRIGTATLEGYRGLGALLVHNAKGKIIQRRQGKLLLGDVRKEKYRSWLMDRIRNMLAKTGTDGVTLDVAIRTPSKMLSGICRSNPKFCADYANGMDRLSSVLKARIYPKMVLYNGLWSLHRGQLEDQEKLLRYADGGAIEYFGMHPKRGISPFEEGIFSYLKIMRNNPEKLLLVFGRGPWHYTDYAEDYLWQRYLYCAYLLAAGPNTLFKYHASFQVPHHAGRSGGLDTYTDWGFDIGEPIGSFQFHDGLYLRCFYKVVILVAPHDGQPQRYTLKDPAFTSEGKRVQGMIDIKPGTGLLLFKTLPHRKPREPLCDNWQDNMASWRWAKICIDNDGSKFIQLKALPKGLEGEHDLMLDPIRSIHPRPILRLRVRTKDDKAKFLAMAEVDDKRRQRMRVLVTLASDVVSAKTPRLSMVRSIQFRSSSPMARGKIPVVKMKNYLPADGQWHDIIINGARLLDLTQRYTFRRWCWLRPVGSLDMESLEFQWDNNR